MVAAHVFVDDLDEPVLSPDDEHHLRRVLRLRPGEAVSASDGRGSLRPCEWAGAAALRVTGDVAGPASTPTPRLVVAVALAKGDKPEWAVQKLTECGIDEIALFEAERSVVRWDDPSRTARHLDRLGRVAREAAMQSRRVWLPEVTWSTFADLLARPGAALADAGGSPPSLDHLVVLVGPEGGWSPSERAAAPARVALGPHVLRAETAAVAAGVLLTALREVLVGPTGE